MADAPKDTQNPNSPAGSRQGKRRSWFGRLAGCVAALPRIAILGAAALAAASFTGLALFIGFEIAERELPSYEFFARVDRKLAKTLLPKGPPNALVSQTFPSLLINLEADIGIVDTGRRPVAHPISEKGGGLASFGPDVLLLPYTGRIYAASSSKDIRATRIVAPDNNRAAYEAVGDDPAFAELTVRKGYLRYNDLLSFESETGRGLIASYTEYNPDRMCVTNTLARLDIDPSVTSIDEVEAGPDDWEIIFRTEPCLPLKTRYLAVEGHLAGGRMTFEAPATLYLTSGDFHYDGMRSEPGPGIAQDPVAQYGKILAVDIGTGEGRIMSMGNRNPQGIILTPDGTLFSVEHGPRGGDELNRIREGANFGWPLESYGVTYEGGGRIPGSLSYGRHETFEPPVFSWVPSVATSGMAYVKNFHPAWDGDLLVATLADKSLYRLRMVDDRVVYSERIEIGTRIRYVLQHPDGRLVLWTDNNELIFLTGVDRANNAEILAKFIRQSQLSNRTVAGLETALATCAECHSYEAGANDRAPNLARIYGNEIAATAYEQYSNALRGKGGLWTRENLAAFVRDPEGFAPGTAMPDPFVDDEEVIRALVSYLEKLDSVF